MNRIATWPAPRTATSSEILEVREYYRTASATLADGTIIRPTLQTARAIVGYAAAVTPTPMVVEFGSWR